MSENKATPRSQSSSTLLRPSASPSNDDQPHCRICLLSIEPSEFESGPGSGPTKALALGCHCRNTLQYAHLECARKWFAGMKRTTRCEVCTAECTGLPSALVEEIEARRVEFERARASRLLPISAANLRELALSRGGFPQRHSVLNFLLGAFGPFLLVVSALLLGLYGGTECSLGAASGLASVMGQFPLIHWFFLPELVFHSTLLACVLVGTTIGSVTFFLSVLHMAEWFGVSIAALTSLVLAFLIYAKLAITVEILTNLPVMMSERRRRRRRVQERARSPVTIRIAAEEPSGPAPPAPGEDMERRLT